MSNNKLIIPAPADSPFVPCPECGKQVKKAGLGVHIARVHRKVALKARQKHLSHYAGHNILFCPNCGFEIELLEQAVALLRARKESRQ